MGPLWASPGESAEHCPPQVGDAVARRLEGPTSGMSHPPSSLRSEDGCPHGAAVAEQAWRGLRRLDPVFCPPRLAIGVSGTGGWQAVRLTGPFSAYGEFPCIEVPGVNFSV